MTLSVGEVTAIEFSQDGRLLLAATTSGVIERHPLNVEDLLRAGARRLGRVLTPDELQTFEIGEPRLTAEDLRRYAALEE